MFATVNIIETLPFSFTEFVALHVKSKLLKQNRGEMMLLIAWFSSSSGDGGR